MGKHIHIGFEIESRLNELRLSKTEFGKRIGIPQQNVNRILEKSSIDTEKLIAISNALEFNFFSLYCESMNIRKAGRDYVEKGKIEHKYGQIEEDSTRTSSAPDCSNTTEADLRAQIAQLKSQLEDKDHIISLLKTKP